MKTINITLIFENSRFIPFVLEKTVEQIKQGGSNGSFSTQGINVSYTIEEINVAKPEREIRRELINGVIHEFVKSNI